MKNRALWSLLLALCLPLWLRAAEVTDGPHVSAKGAEAVVSWETDVECGTTVRFGTVAGTLHRKVEGQGVTRTHSATLTGLTPGTTYHFSVGTAKKALRTGQFVAGQGAVAPPPPKPAEKPAVKPAPEPAKPAPAKPAAATSDLRAPPASVTWGNIDTLQDHFVRHGADFRARSAADYAAQAWLFLQRAQSEGLPAKIDPEGVIRVWDPKTRSFAAYNRNGTTKTYFKPDSSDYFQRQPGRPVRLKPPVQP